MCSTAWSGSTSLVNNGIAATKAVPLAGPLSATASAFHDMRTESR